MNPTATPLPAPTPDPDPEDSDSGEATMTDLELQSFDPNDSGEITREDFREATKVVSRAARKNAKKTQMAFKACADTGPLRVGPRTKKHKRVEESPPA